MKLQDPGAESVAETSSATTRLTAKKRAIVLARRRLHRLKLATVAASVLTFGGLSAGIAVQGIGSRVVASASTSAASGTAATKVSTSVSTTATANPTATATGTPAATASSAPIVSAQS